jgi:long-chain acyl-CoA synthetase
MAFSIAGLIRRHGQERPDKAAIIFEDRTISYADLDRRSSQVAQALRAEGVESQDRIAIIDKNGPEYFEVLFGGAKLNAVNVAVNWRLAPREMAYVVNDAEAKVLLVGPEFRSHLDEFRAELNTVKKVVLLGNDYEAWVGAHEADDPGAEAAPDDVAVQLYTSGTTGLPKGAMLMNSNFDTLVWQVGPAWDFDGDSVNLVAMPLFHIAGSGWALVGISVGGTSVLLREVDPARILEVVPKHGITNALLVPAVLLILASTPGIEDCDFTTLRSIVYGASPIAQEVLVRSIELYGCGFIHVYGLTETTGAVTMLSAAEHDTSNPERLKSCGRAFAWLELKIADSETGEERPAGVVGEIWVRSGQNMKGYWHLPDATAATFTGDGWFKTGDAAYMDEDGFVFIHDRVKDMIISGGENIYPAEVENVLMWHEAVADAAVIGVPDERWGEAVKAIVVRKPGADPDPREIIEFCRTQLAHYKCPKSVDWADVLPRNPSGKILKRELREPYWAGQERRVH